MVSIGQHGRQVALDWTVMHRGFPSSLFIHLSNMYDLQYFWLLCQVLFSDILTCNPKYEEGKNRARIYAAAKGNVFITGESGAEKERFAQSIHNASLLSSGPFVAVNCAAFSESVLESELYGYEDGAFTGAKRGGSRGS